MASKEKTHHSEHNAEKEAERRQLILYNDDVHTFDFVINSLIVVCEHDPLQAENCALIAHYKGKCPVKSGSFNELVPYYTEMKNRELIVEIK